MLIKGRVLPGQPAVSVGVRCPNLVRSLCCVLGMVGDAKPYLKSKFGCLMLIAEILGGSFWTESQPVFCWIS